MTNSVGTYTNVNNGYTFLYEFKFIIYNKTEYFVYLQLIGNIIQKIAVRKSQEIKKKKFDIFYYFLLQFYLIMAFVQTKRIAPLLTKLLIQIFIQEVRSGIAEDIHSKFEI